MSSVHQRVRGRAVPPPRPCPAVEPIVDEIIDDLVVLRFDPPLTRAAFRAFAAAHGLAHRPTAAEPQLFATADDVEVAYGYNSSQPLPEAVAELLLCGGAAPRPLAVATLARAMLLAWPHARWEAHLPAGLRRMLAEVAPAATPR